MDFRSRVALVTGGSSGIGLAVARQLAARGAHVWLSRGDRAKLDSALADVEARRIQPDQRCGVVVADVADAAQASAAVAEVTAQAGTPDLVINSAGITYPGYFQDIDLAIFHQIMDINYYGTLHVIKAVIPAMLARGSGHIVNVSSLAGLIGVFGYSAYGASKFAVRGLSDVLRSELKPLGIGVSVVYPPDTDTPQLAYENQFKPYETKALAGNANVMSADAVATEILRGVSRGRYVIIPGSEGKLLFGLSGLLGTGVYPIIDLMVSRAQRSQGKKS